MSQARTYERFLHWTMANKLSLNEATLTTSSYRSVYTEPEDAYGNHPIELREVPSVVVTISVTGMPADELRQYKRAFGTFKVKENKYGSPSVSQATMIVDPGEPDIEVRLVVHGLFHCEITRHCTGAQAPELLKELADETSTFARYED